MIEPMSIRFKEGGHFKRTCRLRSEMAQDIFSEMGELEESRIGVVVVFGEAEQEQEEAGSGRGAGEVADFGDSSDTDLGDSDVGRADFVSSQKAIAEKLGNPQATAGRLSTASVLPPALIGPSGRTKSWPGNG